MGISNTSSPCLCHCPIVDWQREEKEREDKKILVSRAAQHKGKADKKSVMHFLLSQCWFNIIEGAEPAETSLMTTMQCVGKVLSECSTRQFGLVHNR